MRRLEERAVRRGWDTAPDYQSRIIDQLVGLILPKPGRPRKDAQPATREEIVRISRTLIAASLGQQKLDLAKSKTGALGPRVEGDIIEEAARRAMERRAERERERAARESS